MADDEVPPAFDPGLPSEAPAFDPNMPEERISGRERERAYRQSLREGDPSLPAGQAAPGPDLSHERGTAGQIASEWGDIGKGMLKGPAAAISGGALGDLESLGKGIAGVFLPPGSVPPKTAAPTTMEGGYLGPRGLGVMDEAANPREAFGMGVGAGALPFGPKAIRGTVRGIRGPTDLTDPPGPPGGPTPITRGDSGVRMLPADIPHRLPPGTSTVGAEAASPLQGYSQATIDYLRNLLKNDPVTAWTLQQRLEEMSPHQSLAEFSPHTEYLAGGLATHPEARNELVNFLKARGNERPQRVNYLIDDAIGEKENLATLQRARDAERKKTVDPLYQKFRDERIPPPSEPGQVAAMDLLMDRLRAADAFGIAKHKARLEGVPWDDAFGGYGPIPEGRWPTTQSWDYVKRALDQKIADSMVNGRSTDYTRLYQKLKNDMMETVDSDTWRQARAAYATPSQITEAEKLGRQFFKMDPDELPYLFGDFNEAQKAGYLRGLRKELSSRMGGKGSPDRQVIKEIISPNTTEKLRAVLPADKVDDLINAVTHEDTMLDAPSRIYGNSPTAPRLQAGALWSPPSATEKVGQLVSKGLHLAHKPVSAGMDLLAGAGEKALSKRMAKIREEASRIFTLQGPERDTVLRYLLEPPEPPRSTGGRVLPRAAGGRAVGTRPSRPLLQDARQAPDGNWYVPDKSRPGKYLRIDPT